MASPIRAEHVVIATGAKPRPLAIPGEELDLTSEQFMAAETLGRRIVFIGGGYVSFEFAHMAAASGAHVTILHRGPQVLAGFDPRLAEMLALGYREAGIDIRVNAPVTAVEAVGDERVVVLGDGSRIACDVVVHGAGRVPDLDALELGAGRVTFTSAGLRSTMRCGVSRTRACGLRGTRPPWARR